MIPLTKWQLLLYSAILGGFAEVGYLLTSFVLDKFMNKKYSNFFGLLVDIILDYISQFWIFLGQVEWNTPIILKFGLYRIFDLFLRQSLFVISLNIPFVKKYIDTKKQTNEKYEAGNQDNPIYHRTTQLRYLITVFYFFIFTFPMRKYITFTK